jgi:hypothetical protein
MGRKESDSTVLCMYPAHYAHWACGAGAMVPFAPLGLLGKAASSRGLTPTAKAFRPSGPDPFTKTRLRPGARRPTEGGAVAARAAREQDDCDSGPATGRVAARITSRAGR